MDVKYVSTKPLEEFAINKNHKADDLISRQDVIDAICTWDKFGVDGHGRVVRWYEGLEPYVHLRDVVFAIEKLPSAQAPSYVAEIEAEYKKAVSQQWIHKPLAKALYGVWKKHDREDVSRPWVKEREEE